LVSDFAVEQSGLRAKLVSGLIKPLIVESHAVAWRSGLLVVNNTHIPGK
jgi:hypothetical protein